MHITHINLARGFSGGERQTALLIGRLSGKGIEQRLVCRSDAPLRKLLQATPGLTFHTAGSMFSGHRFGRMETDIFHAHEAKAAHWAFLETRLGGRPYVITRRVPNPLKTYGITPAVYKKAAAVAAISSKIKKTLEAYNPGLFIPLIPSAAGELPNRPEQVGKLRRKYENRFVIGHIGTLRDRAKGQADVIGAARHLSARHRGLHFVFLGKGEDENRLKSMAAGMENIEFAGYTQYPGDYLSVMDIFVFPSPEEGLGSSILDAMDYGVPVVASNVGGIPDIVAHEKNGVLVPPRDKGALADAIERLYGNPDLRERFSRAGRATAAAYSPGAMAERYLALYGNICK